MIAVKVLPHRPHFVQVIIDLQVVDVFHCYVECCLLLYLTDKVLWARSRTPDGRVFTLIFPIRMRNTTPKFSSFSRSSGMAGIEICLAFLIFSLDSGINNQKEIHPLAIEMKDFRVSKALLEEHALYELRVYTSNVTILCLGITNIHIT